MAESLITASSLLLNHHVVPPALALAVMLQGDGPTPVLTRLDDHIEDNLPPAVCAAERFRAHPLYSGGILGPGSVVRPGFGPVGSADAHPTVAILGLHHGAHTKAAGDGLALERTPKARRVPGFGSVAFVLDAHGVLVVEPGPVIAVALIAAGPPHVLAVPELSRGGQQQENHLFLPKIQGQLFPAFADFDHAASVP